MDSLYYSSPFFVNGGSVYLMTLGSYGGFFDESERLGKTDPLCVAGFVFKENAYRQFCRGWSSFLKRALGKNHGINAMHMTDLVQGKEEFKGVDIPSRVSCLQKASKLVREHALLATGAMFDQKEFEEKAGDDWPQTFGSSYTCLCQRAAETTALWLQHKQRVQPVVYTFESGHKWEHETDQVFLGIRRNEMLRKHYQYGHHTFMDKKDCYGAQAADMIAWSAVRIHMQDKSRSLQPFLPELVKFVEHFNAKENAMVRYLTGDILEDFITQQKERPLDPGIQFHVGPAKRKFR